MSIEQTETPFPWLRMGALNVGMLAHTFLFTAPLPYIAFMVVDFGMEPTTDEAGYWAGWIASAFMIGRIVSGIPWGIMADRVGRKPCLLISMVAIILLGLLFGLSTTFAMAVSVRFSIGIFNGFMSTAKICVTELAETKEHEVRGFGYLNGAYGLGMVLGPAIGGLLARPAIQYPGVFSASGLWGRYPYLLPSVVCASVGVVAFVLMLLFIPETASFASNIAAKENVGYSMVETQNSDKITIDSTTDEEDSYEGSLVSNENGIKTYAESLETGKWQKSTYSPFTISNYDDEEGFEDIDGSSVDSKEIHQINNSTKPCTSKEVLSSGPIQLLLSIYCIFSLLILYMDEVVPLYCVTSIDKGGLGWEAAEVGIALAIVGFGVIIFQLFIYSYIMRVWFIGGPADSSCKWMLITALGIAITPILIVLVVYITGVHSPSKTKVGVVYYVAVLIPSLLYHLAATAVFTSLAMMVNASVDASMRGMMNGITMTVGSIGKGLGPICGATFYAIIVGANLPFPLNSTIVFFLAAIAMIVIALIMKNKLSILDSR